LKLLLEKAGLKVNYIDFHGSLYTPRKEKKRFWTQIILILGSIGRE